MKDYIEQQKNQFLEELFELLRIPSVSANSSYAPDVRKAADFIEDKLKQAGCQKTALFETAGFPIIYGELLIDESKPTVLVYGHYDVQPPEPLELWVSPPFEPEIRDGKIFARGASDDKGQVYMHIKALQTMVQTGNLSCNVKFLIEGEEEIGSANLEQFVKNNLELLRADLMLISDTGMLSNENPSITVGLRGMSYVEVELTGPNRDLHSGMYGGAVANPVNVLCQMIASMHDENNRVTIPGFYDDVEELSDADKEALLSAPFDPENYKKEIGLDALHGEKGYSTLEHLGTRPTLDVNGIWGGYIGEGPKTVLPSKAYAKISMRLVPNQSSEKITELFQQHFERIAPSTVKVKVAPMHGGEAAVTPTDAPGYLAASKAVEQVWGKKPIPMRDGGSIPIVALFENELNINVILMGFGLDEDAIHSPNESYGVENYLKGIETICSFFQHYKGNV